MLSNMITSEHILFFVTSCLLKCSLVFGCPLQECRDWLLWTWSCDYVLCWTCRWSLLKILHALMFECRTFEVLSVWLTCYDIAFSLDLGWNKIWNPFCLHIITFSGREVGCIFMYEILLTFWRIIEILFYNLVSNIGFEIFLWGVSCEKVGFKKILLIFVLSFRYIWVRIGLIGRTSNRNIVRSGPACFDVKPLWRWRIHVIYIYWKINEKYTDNNPE